MTDHNAESLTVRQEKQRRAVARWLLLGVAILLIQILLGGITRLTGSGLSIAEWKPILGAVPPMNQEDWNQAFELYKQKASGQFLTQNADYTLSDFKAIYFWEWMHREWARIALSGAFLIGFVYFLVKKYFGKGMVTPLIVLFLLGALQGAVGWIMVASGLNPDDTHVSHIKLAMHFMFALVLLCYTLWFALKLRVKPEAITYNTGLKGFAGTILVLFALQLCYGAFMAGLKAAPAAATWPDINGSFFPADIHQFGSARYSGVHILTDHPLMVHFIHRSLAYLITALLLVFFFRVRSAGATPEMRRAAGISAGLVLLQVLLGVCTILNAPLMTQSKFQRFEWLAELHQMVAILLLVGLVYNYFLLRKQR
ncbi:COX15/CtaA family protein [Rurimicrobium arvi]|uniref:COX15/CtaA family protein n=1 Tax=Rurimicrobium arvi TaxID=2049916 RepID=A0ABP8MIV2_9BACT